MIKNISYSLINSWSMCGELVRQVYFLDNRVPPGIAAKIGGGVHKGAEVNHRAKIHTRQDEPLDVVQDAARDGYVKSVKEGGVFFPPDEAAGAKKALAEGVDRVTSLAGLYHSDLAPKIQPVAVEERITLAPNGLLLPVVGIIDVVDEDNWVPDIKTAGRSWSQDRADTSHQATIYRELAKQEYGQEPRMSFEVLVSTKTPKHQSLETVRTDEDWDLLKKRIRIMLEQLQAGIFPPADPGHWKCAPKWCGFWWTCPYIPSHKQVIPKGGGKYV